jgi:hypothetical protein
MSPKRHIKLATLIKPAESIEARAIQVIKQLSCLASFPFPLLHQSVEFRAMSIKEFFLVTHLDGQLKTAFEMRIEIDQMRIDVIQKRSVGPQREWHCQPTAEGLDKPAALVRFPKSGQVRGQPTFSSCPLQRWF